MTDTSLIYVLVGVVALILTFYFLLPKLSEEQKEKVMKIVDKVIAFLLKKIDKNEPKKDQNKEPLVTKPNSFVIRVIRKYIYDGANGGTYGDVYIVGYNNDNELIEFKCNSAENTEKLIPARAYEAVLEYSPKFKRDLIELKDVPGRTEIKFHQCNIGNRDTEGCIGVGVLINADKIGKLKGGGSSTETLNKMMSFFNKDSKIIVIVE